MQISPLHKNDHNRPLSPAQRGSRKHSQAVVHVEEGNEIILGFQNNQLEARR